ncbi:MAG TPA: hypothetical protein DCL32_07740 [Gammaproteobacteria bacterium]|nr:hypothetical protein [Gammaproteobacteria bacterium]
MPNGWFYLKAHHGATQTVSIKNGPPVLNQSALDPAGPERRLRLRASLPTAIAAKRFTTHA